MPVKYLPDNRTNADVRRVTRTAVEQYRQRFYSRCIGLDERSLKVRIAQEEARSRVINVDDAITDRIKRTEGRETTFRCEGDPRSPSCTDPVFVCVPDALITVFEAGYWREQMCRHLLPDVRLRPHAIDRFQERCPYIRKGEATALDLYEALDRATFKIDAPSDHSEPRVYYCEIDPRIDPGSTAPVFVLTNPEETEDGLKLRWVSSIITCDMANRTLIGSGRVGVGITIPPPPEPTPTPEPVAPEPEPEPEETTVTRRGPTFKNDADEIDRKLYDLENGDTGYDRGLIAEIFGIAENTLSNWRNWYDMPLPSEYRKVRQWMRNWYEMRGVRAADNAYERESEPDTTEEDDVPETNAVTPTSNATVRIAMQVPADQIATALGELLSKGRTTVVNGNVELELIVERDE